MSSSERVYSGKHMAVCGLDIGANHMLRHDDVLQHRKRTIIETINDQLKNISQIEHSRHRSPLNFVVNLFAGLIAYCWQPKKAVVAPT